MTITIPLNLLQISPLNARKTPPRATEQAELAASIVAHGLLENLVVRPTDNDHYEVLAGGGTDPGFEGLARQITETQALLKSKIRGLKKLNDPAGYRER